MILVEELEHPDKETRTLARVEFWKQFHQNIGVGEQFSYIKAQIDCHFIESWLSQSNQYTRVQGVEMEIRDKFHKTIRRRVMVSEPPRSLDLDSIKKKYHELLMIRLEVVKDSEPESPWVQELKEAKIPSKTENTSISVTNSGINMKVKSITIEQIKMIRDLLGKTNSNNNI